MSVFHDGLNSRCPPSSSPAVRCTCSNPVLPRSLVRSLQRCGLRKSPTCPRTEAGPQTTMAVALYRCNLCLRPTLTCHRRTQYHLHTTQVQQSCIVRSLPRTFQGNPYSAKNVTMRSVRWDWTWTPTVRWYVGRLRILSVRALHVPRVRGDQRRRCEKDNR
eukprot:PhF_6_TR11337/c0_g1_i2/m.18317